MLFDDARVPKSEVTELIDKLNTTDKEKAIAYMKSFLDTRDDRNRNRLLKYQKPPAKGGFLFVAS